MAGIGTLPLRASAPSTFLRLTRSAGRASRNPPDLIGSDISSFQPHPLASPCLASPRLALRPSFSSVKNSQTHPEASLLVPMESGRGGFESLLEHDSKAQPPLCTCLDLHIAS